MTPLKPGGIFFGLLRLGLFTALWCALLWLALPLDLAAASPGALVGMHLAPPLLLEGLWRGLRRLPRWRANRAQQKAAAAAQAAEQTQRSAALAEQQRAMQRRRACVECRAVWLASPEAPSWYDGPRQQTPDTPAAVDAGQDDPLCQTLTHAFRNAAAPWLPLYLAGGADPMALARIESAWHKALAASGATRKPPYPGCKALPGHGVLADRLVTLFDEDPSLPAFMLLGLENPPPGERAAPVAAVLVNRPGLQAAETGADDESLLAAGPDMLPFWERAKLKRNAETDQTAWDKMPPSAQAALLAAPVIGVLHRTHASPAVRGNLARIAQARIEDALENAGLREAPRKEGEPTAEQTATAEAGLAGPAWFIYNGGRQDEPENGQRLAALVTALLALGHGIDPIHCASNASAQPGSAPLPRLWMLAEALVQCARLQKPVLLAEFDGNGDVQAGIVRPACA
ncbi:MAG: hypothetical protein LBF91_03330 [Azoarcus sp.]|jgi:hypothetical protein|nr:hypothetical protein [Azoarcus sp.]